MIIDSHCHLNYEPMSLSLKETIERANNDGVKYLLTISTEDKSFDKILKIIKSKKKRIYQTKDPLNLKQYLRDDEVTENNKRDLFQENNKNTADGYYKVPKIID